MNFRLVDSGWGQLLNDALKQDHSSVRVISPFIKKRAASRLLEFGNPLQLEVITRFNLDEFLQGVSDLAALRLLLDAGGVIRGIRNLHAKAYLIGSDHAVVSSANLTEQGLLRNHEFGFYAQDPEIVASCHAYFASLWKKAGGTYLSFATLEEWERRVARSLALGAGTRPITSLGDEGVDLGFPESPVASDPVWVEAADQGFVKFFGEGSNRERHSLPVLEEVKRAGCHWACTFPKSKKPRQVQDGAIMFMGRLVGGPSDTLIFGRAIGLQYQEGRDDATAAEIELRPWKARWPRYVRVHDAEFINGTLSQGISLNELMESLGSNSFASTRRHVLEGQGNTNPRSAFNQQPAVELSSEAISWLNSRFDQALIQQGRISPAVLDQLDWPNSLPTFKVAE